MNNCFLEKLNKIDKALGKLMKKKRNSKYIELEVKIETVPLTPQKFKRLLEIINNQMTTISVAQKKWTNPWTFTPYPD